MGESKRRAEAKAKGIVMEIFKVAIAHPLQEAQAASRVFRTNCRKSKVEVVDYPLTSMRIEHKSDKGLKNGSCNRSACQQPGATWYNSGSRAYYCTKCAGMINDAHMGRTMFEQSMRTPLCVDEAEDPEGTEKFVCVRIYPDGEAKYTVRDKEGMECWVEYNLGFRGGQMLFVNAEYKGGGPTYLKNRIEDICDYLASKLVSDLKRPIERPRMQPEYCGGIDLGTRERYNDERLYENLRSVIRD